MRGLLVVRSVVVRAAVGRNWWVPSVRPRLFISEAVSPTRQVEVFALWAPLRWEAPTPPLGAVGEARPFCSIPGTQQVDTAYTLIKFNLMAFSQAIRVRLWLDMNSDVFLCSIFCVLHCL